MPFDVLKFSIVRPCLYPFDFDVLPISFQKEKVSPESISSKFHEGFVETFDLLNFSYTLYTRTSTDFHKNEVKELLKKAKCLLDIVPPNTDCNTLRVNEAMSYKCKILTNNSLIVKEEYFDPKSISVYSEPSQINIDFLLEGYTNPDYDGYIKKLGPEALVQHLEKTLFEKGDRNE